MKTIESSLRKRSSSFGLFERHMPGNLSMEAKEAVKDLVRLLDKYMESSQDKEHFLSSLGYYLGGLIAGVCEAEVDENKHVRSPKWFFDKGEYKQYLGQNNCPINDHFGMRKGKYVSHEYGLSYGQLKTAIEWADKRGMEFDLSANSNYFPFHTIQVTFRKTDQ